MKSWAYSAAIIRDNSTFEGFFKLMNSYGNVHAAEMTRKDGKHVYRSYADYELMVKKASEWFQGKFSKNDFVGLACDTDMDWTVLFWALLRSGARPILLNPAMNDEMLSGLLKESNAVGYVSESKREIPLQWFSKADILANEMIGKENWADEVALCTSGTVSNSRIFIYDGKAVSNQFFGLIGFSEYGTDAFYDPAEKELRPLASLPLFHVFGFMLSVIFFPAIKATMIYLPDKSLSTFRHTCISERVTNIYSVPVIFNSLAEIVTQQYGEVTPEKVPMIRKSLLGDQVKYIICGGNFLPPRTAKIFCEIGYPIHNGFGMTEAGLTSVDGSLNPEIALQRFVGRPFVTVEYKVDETGELLIRGSSLFSSKFVDGKIIPRNPEEWYPTGDMAHIQDGGMAYIDGRKKDIIINATGENVYPDEVESYFAGIKGVKNLVVLGLKIGINAHYEEPVLVIEATGDVSRKEILAEVINRTDKLSIYMKPRRVFFSKTSLPQTSFMKVRRQIVKNELGEGSFPVEEVQLSTRGDESDLSEKANDVRAIEQYLIALVARNLGGDISSITTHHHLIYDLGADSMLIHEMISQVEDDYKIFFTDSEQQKNMTVHELAKLIYRKINGEDALPEANEVKAKDEPENERITSFSESPEYAAFMARIRSSFPRPEINPYFVAHDSVIRDTSVVRGKSVINLGSYNYLGMSGNPETSEAAKAAIDKYGMSASGSRTLAGEKTIYQKLEQTIAAWKHTEDCIVCSSGWGTNVTFIATFMKEGDMVLYDMLSHNSIMQGIKMSDAESKSFPHNDLDMLEKILQGIQGRYRKVLIVVEGVYSMDGDIAPIPRFVELKQKYGCFLMVDEAHSTGVIGEHGGGVDDHFHLQPRDIDFKIGTLSKALGTCGGYVAADHAVVEYLRYNMDGFVFSAGISPAIAAAVTKAIEMLRDDNSLVIQLHRNIEYFLRRAKEEGLNTGLSSGTAIIPVLIGSDADAAQLSHDMLENGVFVPPAMYPAVPKGQSRLRFSISAVHTTEQLERAVTLCGNLMREYGLIH